MFSIVLSIRCHGRRCPHDEAGSRTPDFASNPQCSAHKEGVLAFSV